MTDTAKGSSSTPVSKHTQEYVMTTTTTAHTTITNAITITTTISNTFNMTSTMTFNMQPKFVFFLHVPLLHVIENISHFVYVYNTLNSRFTLQK
jgi:hypothetical protein